MDEFSRNRFESPPGKLKFRKNIWMSFPGFDNKGQSSLASLFLGFIENACNGNSRSTHLTQAYGHQWAFLIKCYSKRSIENEWVSFKLVTNIGKAVKTLSCLKDSVYLTTYFQRNDRSLFNFTALRRKLIIFET